MIARSREIRTVIGLALLALYFYLFVYGPSDIAGAVTIVALIIAFAGFMFHYARKLGLNTLFR
jgi:hypothetical protein